MENTTTEQEIYDRRSIRIRVFTGFVMPENLYYTIRYLRRLRIFWGWRVTIDAATGTKGGVRLPGRRRTRGTARLARALAPATTKAGARPQRRRRLRMRPPGPPPTTTRNTRNHPRRDTPATVSTTRHVSAVFPKHLSYFTTNSK